MPTFCTQAKACICYLDRLRAILSKVPVTSTPLYHSPPLLWTNVDRWSCLAERLVNGIREIEALRGVCSDFDSSSTVFQILTSGFRETINWLEASLKETAKTPNQSTMEELNERVVLHLAATDLMTLYLERYLERFRRAIKHTLTEMGRERSRHIPNARTEIHKWDDKWFEQRGKLEARLKNVFRCSSTALTHQGSIAGAQKPAETLNRREHLLEATPSTKHPLLTNLHLEMGEIASGASHDAYLDVLMRISIYYIAKVRISKFAWLTRGDVG